MKLATLEWNGKARMRNRSSRWPRDSSKPIASSIAGAVEQNRDGQLRSLIINENGIDPVRLVSIVHYDGTPITARFIANAIGDHQDHLKVTPLRKAVS